MAAADCADDTDAAVSIGAQLISYNTATFYASGTSQVPETFPEHSSRNTFSVHSESVLRMFREHIPV